MASAERTTVKGRVMEGTPDAYTVENWHRRFDFGLTVKEPHNDEARHLHPVLRANMPIVRGDCLPPFPKPPPPKPKGPKPAKLATDPSAKQFHGGFFVRIVAHIKRAISH